MLPKLRFESDISRGNLAAPFRNPGLQPGVEYASLKYNLSSDFASQRRSA